MIFAQPHSSGAVQAAYSSIYGAASMTVPAGVSAEQGALSLLNDTGTMAMVVAVLLIVAFSYKKGYIYFKNLNANLFSIRVRNNAFNDYTVSERGIMSAMLLNMAAMGGILLYSHFATLIPAIPAGGKPVFVYVGSMSLLLLAFLGAQNLLYLLLGYVFSDPPHTSVLIVGFRAAHSFLGALLLVPVAMLMINPAYTRIAVFIGLICYVLMRMVFIWKGFRIFFLNFKSLFYFILYLCSVEIIPSVLLYFGALKISHILLEI